MSYLIWAHTTRFGPTCQDTGIPSHLDPLGTYLLQHWLAVLVIMKAEAEGGGPSDVTAQRWREAAPAEEA